MDRVLRGSACAGEGQAEFIAPDWHAGSRVTLRVGSLLAKSADLSSLIYTRCLGGSMRVTFCALPNNTAAFKDEILMLKRSFVLLLTISIAPLVLAQVADEQEVNRRRIHSEKARQRQEEFYRMRAYPAGHIPAGARAAAVHEMESINARERLQSPLARSPRVTLSRPPPTHLHPQAGQACPPF